jgi:hypothetical protein
MLCVTTEQLELFLKGVPEASNEDETAEDPDPEVKKDEEGKEETADCNGMFAVRTEVDSQFCHSLIFPIFSLGRLDKQF